MVARLASDRPFSSEWDHSVVLEEIDTIRRFSRFYTHRIGVLRRKLYDSPFSLAESRVMYELGTRESPTAKELGAALGLDAGYLSRMLTGFERNGLLIRRRSATDARSNVLELTSAGWAAFERLEDRSREEVGGLLRDVSDGDLTRLTRSLKAVENILADGSVPTPDVALREHRPGDMGWVIERHAAVYAKEYGWDSSFEALVAEIAAKFLRTQDPGRERCWIAERDGERLGCVFLVRETDEIARLRLLLVEPSARGLGLGGRLVGECIGFAREVGYRQVTLWTNDVLTAACRLYQRAGFKLVAEAPHNSFGDDLVGQDWTLDL